MSADHAELVESARQVLEGVGRAAPEKKIWPLVVELGWLLAAVPEDLGGLEQGLPAAVALYSELGAGLASAPYLPAMLSMDAICHGHAADRSALVERFATTDLATASLGDSALSIAGGQLNGIARAVQSASAASHMLVYNADEECVALAPLAQAGVEILARPTWDVTRRLSDVRFDNVALDPSLILAEGPAARALCRRIQTHRDFALAADSSGGASALLAMTVDYLQTRRQFGRPLAMFQALKHRCAELKAMTLASEAFLLDSMGRLAGETSEGAAILAKMTKVHATSMYAKVGEEAIQLHGGIGMTAEYPCHLFVKRAFLNAHLGRANDACELDIADAVLATL